MLKRIQRITATKSSVRVSVRILSLQFGRTGIIAPGSLLSVCYENRGKSKATTFKPVQESDGSSFVTIEEYVDFSASIYISPSGKPMRKSRELCIRQQDSKKTNVSAEIGKVELNLNDIPEAVPSRFSLNVTQNGRPLNAKLEVLITITNHDEDYVPDDMSSIASDVSYSRQSGFRDHSSPARLKSIQSDSARQTESKDLEESHGLLQMSMDLEKAIVGKENVEALYNESLRENAELQKTIAELNLEKDQLMRDKATLEAEKGALRSEFQEQVGKFYTQLQEKEMLEIQLQELKSTVNSLTSTSASSNISLTSELAAATKEAASLRYSNSELEGLAEELQLRVSDLEATIFTRQESEGEMRRHIQQLKSRISSAEANETAGYELVATLRGKVTDLEGEIECLQSDNADLHRRVEDFEKQLAVAETTAQAATAAAAAAEAALAIKIGGSGNSSAVAGAHGVSGGELGPKYSAEEDKVFKEPSQLASPTRTAEDIKLQSTITEANSRLEMMISQIDQYSQRKAEPSRRESRTGSIDPLVELARDMGAAGSASIEVQENTYKVELQAAQTALITAVAQAAAVEALVDEEREKNRALKTCMIRFASSLNAEEVDMLFDAGIILSMQK